MTVPAPWQRVHGCEIENRPWTCDSRPRPWQRGQTFGSVPGLAPVPWQVVHRDGAATVSGTCAPSSAWSNEIVTSASRSVPRAASGRRAPPFAPPPKRVPRMSAEPAGLEAAEAARARGPAAPRPAAAPAGAEEDPAAVVLLALARAAHDVVGPLDLLEALLGLRAGRVAVRVVLARELAVGLLDRGG